MNKQILFNFLFKNKLYEIGNPIAIMEELRDLNGRIIPERCIEEFKKMIIIENKY